MTRFFVISCDKLSIFLPKHQLVYLILFFLEFDGKFYMHWYSQIQSKNHYIVGMYKDMYSQKRERYGRSCLQIVVLQLILQNEKVLGSFSV